MFTFQLLCTLVAASSLLSICTAEELAFPAVPTFEQVKFECYLLQQYRGVPHSCKRLLESVVNSSENTRNALRRLKAVAIKRGVALEPKIISRAEQLIAMAYAARQNAKGYVQNATYISNHYTRIISEGLYYISNNDQCTEEARLEARACRSMARNVTSESMYNAYSEATNVFTPRVATALNNEARAILRQLWSLEWTEKQTEGLESGAEALAVAFESAPSKEMIQTGFQQVLFLLLLSRV
ncbi:putative Glutamic acid alanine rich protein of Trypanosoma [Trypanosoma vivax]|nr:putative Glutamic acid alanine rich protein of Trypanosoma [Trypanosoma vivax]